MITEKGVHHGKFGNYGRHLFITRHGFAVKDMVAKAIIGSATLSSFNQSKAHSPNFREELQYYLAKDPDL